MAVREVPDDAPEAFLRAVAALRAAHLRPEVVLEEVPAPQRIAPYAVALSADVVSGDQELATGRFVLLHDPAGQAAWEGEFRAVTFVRAELEPELGADPMLGEVGWSWLLDALESCGARHRAAGGTVTRVVSETFGALSGRPAAVEVEIRASWTPVPPAAPLGAPPVGPDAAAHLAGWGELLCTTAGLPPLPSGVSPLPRRRGR